MNVMTISYFFRLTSLSFILPRLRGRSKVGGYALIEVLVASVLLSVAGTGLYSGLIQGIKAEQTIRQSNAVYGPLRIAWFKTFKDLRNAVTLRDYKFTGKQDEVSFPILGDSNKLYQVRYFWKEGNLIRTEKEIPEAFVSQGETERTVLKDIERLQFQYAYLDAEEKLVFQPFYIEEPYFGIPKAVKIEIKLRKSEKTFSRLIAIPQGRWAHRKPEEAENE